ncbi:hypothetical protein C2S51_034917 [Perilla frutescens var. frutescens]|nr:hypothetical protein C2S51_034917 [Perilla frutescens var. frutescens]
MSTNYNMLRNSKTIKHDDPSPNHQIQSEFHENLGNTDRGEEEGHAKLKGGEEAKISSTESENSVPEEDDDGFKTPTSSIQRIIPAMTETPPPPSRKRHPESNLIRRPWQELRRRLVFVAEAEAESNANNKGGEEKSEAKISSRESDKSVPEEYDDGFKTPTSSIEHKIPWMTKSPPAPIKKRPPYSKLIWRTSEELRRRLLFVAEVEAEAEAESIFSPMSKDNVEEKSMKKAPTLMMR